MSVDVERERPTIQSGDPAGPTASARLAAGPVRHDASAALVRRRLTLLTGDGPREVQSPRSRLSEEDLFYAYRHTRRKP